MRNEMTSQPPMNSPDGECLRRGRLGHAILAMALTGLICGSVPALAEDAQPQKASTTAIDVDAGVPMPESADLPPPGMDDIGAMATAETTKPDAVKAEVPKADAASTDTAKTDAVKTDTAKTDTAKVDAAKREAAKADTPNTDTPKTETAAEPAKPATPSVAATPAAVPAAAPLAAQAAPAEAKPVVAAAPSAADQATAEKLKDLISTKLARYIDRKSERTGAEKFYAARDYKPLWIENGAANARAKAAIARLGKAKDDGLDPADYPAPDFAAATTPEAQAEAELKFTDSVLAFARHAQTGRVAYSRVSGDVAYPDHTPDPADILANMADATDIAAALDSYNPQHPQFKALKAKLADIRGKPKGEEPEVVTIPEGRLIRPGMEDDRVVLLRKRLKIAVNTDSKAYDDTVVEAVKAFQKAKAVNADGIVGPTTVNLLNGKKLASGNIEDIILANMERWRWLPRHLGEPKLGNAYVILNIPDFTLKVMQHGKMVWTTRVVTGKPGNHATPLLSETMKYITVNPTWNVPPSIVYNEYLPALQQDPTVLQRMGLRVEQDRDGSVHISQPPGEANALGRIRFNFPNKFLVYQHDTPDKNLFAHETRAYSHGCMRVQYPDQYAEALLGIALPHQGYTAAKIRSMYGHTEQNINLPTPIPVNITYQTAWVDDNGKLELRKDIYGFDSRVLEWLKGNQRRVADIAIERSQPSYSRPPVRLPAGYADASGYNSGPSFFDFLFGGAPAPESEPVRPRRRIYTR